MRGSSGSKAVLITLLAFAIVLLPNHFPNVAAPGTSQPATFFFHSQNTKTLNTSTGAVIPLAVGSLSGTPISTTLAAYTITLTSNTYQIESGAIFDFQITVTVGGSTARTISLYYDFSSDPSQVSVTFQQRMGITFYSSLNQTGLQTTFFSRNWTTPGR